MSAGIEPGFDVTQLARVEDAGLNASAPPQQRWVDGWLVRFAPGKAKRARCINAVATGRLPLEARLAVCEQIYAEAGLAPIVRVTPFSQPGDLDGQLERRGLQRFDETHVMVLDTLPPPGATPAPKAEFRPVGLEAFAQRVGALRGSPLAQRLAHAQRLVASPVPFSAYELHADGAAVACGQFALEGSLVGLYDVFTAEPARGRGYAALLCRHLIAEAQLRGARQAYLQVESDNRAAIGVYRRLGFRVAYAYHYRAADPRVA